MNDDRSSAFTWAAVVASGILLALAIATAGCATPLATYDRTRAIAATAVAGAWQVLDEVEQAVIRDAIEMGQRGEHVEAEAKLQRHVARVSEAMTALRYAQGTLDAAEKTRPVVELATDRERRRLVAEWVAKLTKLAADLATLVSGLRGAQ